MVLSDVIREEKFGWLIGINIEHTCRISYIWKRLFDRLWALPS